VRHKSPVVRFESAAEMLATFGLHNGGKEYRRLPAAFARIFAATIFFGTDRLNGRAKVIQRSRFNFFREAQLWYQRGSDTLPLPVTSRTIVLSDEFYEEVTAHAIPTDLQAVKVLAASPAVLDLFMWLSYPCFFAKGEEAIPIFGEYGLAAQLGSVDDSRPRRFRAMLDQWLRSVHAIWPECPAVISPDSHRLIINRRTAIVAC
jgi:hypothetical protein